MNLNITWTITAIIAVNSFLAPIFVALTNNKHHSQIRKLELEHDANLRQIDLQQQANIHQVEIYYSDKKQAFSEFIVAAGNFSKSRSNSHMYEALQLLQIKRFYFATLITKNNFVIFSTMLIPKS